MLVCARDGIAHDRLARLHVFGSSVEWRLATLFQTSRDNFATVAKIILFPPHGGVCSDFVPAAPNHRGVDSSMSKAMVKEVTRNGALLGDSSSRLDASTGFLLCSEMLVA